MLLGLKRKLMEFLAMISKMRMKMNYLKKCQRMKKEVTTEQSQQNQQSKVQHKTTTRVESEKQPEEKKE